MRRAAASVDDPAPFGVFRVFRGQLMPPRGLVATHDQQWVAEHLGRVRSGDIEQHQRQLNGPGCSEERADVDVWLEPHEHVVRPERVVDRAARSDPEVRHAAARDSRRRDASHVVSRRCLAVVGDDRRAVVEVAEVEAGRRELGEVDLAQARAERGAKHVTRGPRLLDRRRHWSRAEYGGVLHHLADGQPRHLVGDRLPLGLVGVEEARGRPAVGDGAQHPGQRHGVGHAGVHAVAGERHPQMRRVAGDEDIRVAEPLGHQPAADPILVIEHLPGELWPNAQRVAYGLVEVEVGEVRVSGAQRPVHQPHRPAVDRNHGCADARVETQLIQTGRGRQTGRAGAGARMRLERVR